MSCREDPGEKSEGLKLYSVRKASSRMQSGLSGPQSFRTTSSQHKQRPQFPELRNSKLKARFSTPRHLARPKLREGDAASAQDSGCPNIGLCEEETRIYQVPFFGRQEAQRSY